MCDSFWPFFAPDVLCVWWEAGELAAPENLAQQPSSMKPSKSQFLKSTFGPRVCALFVFVF
jgi:hypothetical protein